MRASWPSLLLLILGIGAAGCASGPGILDDVEDRYEAAIREAEAPDTSAIVASLVAITPHNEELIWKSTPDESPLLVVNWTDAPPDRTSETLSTSEELWVTVAPKVQDFCRASGLEGEDLDMRLRQVLGLRPDEPYTHFVAYWVEPDDLFRPCPDPQISDRDCELDFPAPEHLLRVDPDHKAWFEELRATSYGPGGYPWTRLGYTYDWGDPDDPVGFSEFVITPGASVEVESITDTEAYCRP